LSYILRSGIPRRNITHSSWRITTNIWSGIWYFPTSPTSCTCQTIDEYKNINNAEYWSLSTTYGDNLITVIIRRINNKELHFYSIMDKKAHKPQ
jgi:hypothetical protein